MAIRGEEVFRRYRGVLRLEVNVLRQARPRKVWMCSASPYLPSSKRRVDVSMDDPEVRALLFRTREPSVSTRIACSSAAFPMAYWLVAGPTSEEEWRQMGRASGVGGLRRWWTNVCPHPAGEQKRFSRRGSEPNDGPAAWLARSSQAG